MSVNKLLHEAQTPEVIGYADPWIVALGDSTAIKVRGASDCHNLLS
jgi:hypothetical protein